MNLGILFFSGVLCHILAVSHCNSEKSWDLLYFLKNERNIHLSDDVTLKLNPSSNYSHLFLSMKQLFSNNFLPSTFIIFVKLKMVSRLKVPVTLFSLKDPDHKTRLQMTFKTIPGFVDKLELNVIFDPITSTNITGVNKDFILPFTDTEMWTFALLFGNNKIVLYITCEDTKRPFGYQSIDFPKALDKIFFKDGATLQLFSEDFHNNKLEGEVHELSFSNYIRKLDYLCHLNIDGSGQNKLNFNNISGNLLLNTEQWDEDETSTASYTTTKNFQDFSTVSKQIQENKSFKSNEKKTTAQENGKKISDSDLEDGTYSPNGLNGSYNESSERTSTTRFNHKTILMKSTNNENLNHDMGLSKDQDKVEQNILASTSTDVVKTTKQSEMETQVKIPKADYANVNKETSKRVTAKPTDKEMTNEYIDLKTELNEKMESGTALKTEMPEIISPTDKYNLSEDLKERVTKIRKSDEMILKKTVKMNMETQTIERKTVANDMPSESIMDASNKHPVTYSSGENNKRQSSELELNSKSIEKVNKSQTNDDMEGDCNVLSKLRMQIPEKGIKGEKGEKGETGLKGDMGSPGLNGSCNVDTCGGYGNVKGEKGDPGFCSINECNKKKGDKGEYGSKGEVGLKGDKGDTQPVNIDLIKHLASSIILSEIESMNIFKNLKGQKGEMGLCKCNPQKENPQTTNGFDDNINIGFGALVIDTRESLVKISNKLPQGSLVYLVKEDMLFIKIDQNNNIWRSISLEPRSKDWIFPVQLNNAKSEIRPAPYGNGDAKRLYLIALHLPTMGDLKPIIRQPGGYSGAVFQCQQAGAIHGFSRSLYPLINTDTFNVRYIIKEKYANIPIFNARGEILSVNYINFLSENENLLNDILDFKKNPISENIIAPCIWIGREPNNSEYDRNPESKCLNWMSRDPLENGVASMLNSHKSLFDESNKQLRSCSQQCYILCIQTEPHDS